MKTVVYRGLRFEGSQRLPKGPGSPGGPSDGAQEANEPREFHGSLTYRQESAAKNKVLESPWCRTLCFHMFFLAHVSKTQFFACFSRKSCSPGGNPLGRGETKSSQNDRKNIGFWKLADQNDRKNRGFCIGAEPKPCFFSRFHTARLTFT